MAAAAGIEPGALADTVEVARALAGELYLLLDQVDEYFVYHDAAQRHCGEPSPSS